MSYSCTSTGNSQDPSSSKKSVNPGGGGSNSTANSKPDLTEAMKVKKGCNSTDVGVPVTTEEELLSNKSITPEDVLGLQKITESKCARVREVSENIVGIGCVTDSGAMSNRRSSYACPYRTWHT